jgi:CheY-like chemotaxis protein
MGLGQAVDVAGQLRGLTPNEVRVRPALMRTGPTRWTIEVTTGPLDARGITDLEAEMRSVARRCSGTRFTGWLVPSEPVEPRASERTRTAPGRVRVLIVDDSAPFRRAARELLQRRGYSVVGEADRAASGLAAVERLKPDAVLLDVRLPDGSGLDLCHLLTREQNAPAVLLVSGDSVSDGAVAKAQGARDFVFKADLARVDLHAVWGQGAG